MQSHLLSTKEGLSKSPKSPTLLKRAIVTTPYSEYGTLQSLTGKYRGLQGNPCNENRDPAMRTGIPCNENRVFPVGIDSQGVPCELYRVWVCSVGKQSL